MKKILEIDPEKGVFLSGRQLKASFYDEPMSDGSICLVEATSRPTWAYQTFLAPNELRGVRAVDLPQGFQIIISHPTARSRGLDYLHFQNCSNGLNLVFSVRFTFDDWEERINLIHFVEDIRSLVELRMPGCQAAWVDRDEYGVDICCKIKLEPKDDIYEIFAISDRKMSELHREVISGEGRPFQSLLEVAAVSKESELKWWVRHVIVPVIGGTTVAAVISWFLRVN